MSTSVEDYAAQQAAEWGTYVATTAIFHNGVRACNPGDPVPVSNVEQYGYLEQGLVRETSEPVPTPVSPLIVPLPVGEPVVIDNTKKG